MFIQLHPISSFNGSPLLPCDKSISHRALLMGGLAKGISLLTFSSASSHHSTSMGHDVLSTLECLRKLGVRIEQTENQIRIESEGLKNFHKNSSDTVIHLDCGNSGTTLRLLMGILAGSPFSYQLRGDPSLSRRPMERVSYPLTQMGAKIQLSPGGFAPVSILGVPALRAISYSLPIASAQIKSALLFAGAQAHGTTTLLGKIHSRDHTERLFPHFGIRLKPDLHSISIAGGQTFQPNEIRIPGDLSSAAFWIAGALIVPGSVVEIEDVGLNPTRMGLLRVLKRMGAKIETEVVYSVPEPVGKIRVQYSPLVGTSLLEEEIPELIDELPLLAILATFAHGKTKVKGAGELRYKETDRLKAIEVNLQAMGVKVDVFEDGFSIEGPQVLKGAKIQSFHDHRIAMAFSIASLRAKGSIQIDDSDCVKISYPGFYETLHQLTQG